MIEDRLHGVPRRFQRRFQERVERGLIILKGEERGQIRLRIDAALLVGFPIQVNGQGRNDGELLRQLDQGALHCALGIPEMHPPREGQIPVKPGVLEHATVGLHGEAQESLPIKLRLGLQLQSGAVRVGADEGRALGETTRRPKGNERAVVAGHEVATLGLEMPGVVLAQLGVTRSR